MGPLHRTPKKREREREREREGERERERRRRRRKIKNNQIVFSSCLGMQAEAFFWAADGRAVYKQGRVDPRAKVNAAPGQYWTD